MVGLDQPSTQICNSGIPFFTPTRVESQSSPHKSSEDTYNPKCSSRFQQNVQASRALQPGRILAPSVHVWVLLTQHGFPTCCYTASQGLSGQKHMRPSHCSRQETPSPKPLACLYQAPVAGGRELYRRFNLKIAHRAQTKHQVKNGTGI